MARLNEQQRRLALVLAAALALIATVAVTLLAGGGSSGREDAAAKKPGAGPRPGGGQHARPPAATVKPVPEDIAHATESGGRAVNITIDDGPDPTWTPQVLEVLDEHGVKATFCMIGPQAKAHPDLVKRVVGAGHRLCNHTVGHDVTMDRKPVAYQERQILDSLKMIEEASDGAEVPYYRAPGGAFTPDSRRIAAAHGMRPLGWNVDTKDFELPGSDRIVRTVKAELANGPTILFHDGGGQRGQTVAALRQVLPWLKERGYGFSFPEIRPS
ncbi:polysaccharide deacetylase family protein [Streptomyces pactum]|uniref:Polysaccharide deacetylase family protein n=1 Tax=Streptomyces pactum TaxID=68249 RepID=A0ABS0NPJ5_9ACTN|nr:polysaccharide deacetylase family protein [Streptomyces pactum]MBH5336979.1 polysaccharide deacetylase family protein [Streptomyces pactum]